MHHNRSTEIKVGLVSIAAIGLLIAGILLGKGVSIPGTQNQIVVRMASSGGIEQGAPVVVNGVRRGTVTSVRADVGTVVVRADVADISDLFADASARVSILEITGGKKLEVLPGSTGTFDRTREIPGVVAADIVSLVDDLGSVSGDARSLIRRLDTIAGSLTDLLADGSVSQNIRTMASDGALLVHDLRTFLANNSADLQRTLKNVGILVDDLRTAVGNNEPRVARLLDNLDRTVADANDVIRRSTGTLTSVDSLVSNMNGIVADIRTNRSVANRLLYDADLGRRLDSAINDLGRFVKSARASGVNVNVGLGHR
jgi:phospholipid/cholesterol/gamma-HCH transport system substrate-binding protein